MSTLTMIGVPSSAGSYAAGQDQAPRALRAAGLGDALRAAGVDLADAGDLTEQIWAPDPDHPRAMNADQVTASVAELADRAGALLAGDRRLLVIGGNCTIAAGVLAGMRTALDPPAGLVYVDRHFDMNVPESTIEGALDWMGLAHVLDLPGCLDEFAAALGPRPLLGPDQLVFLGADPATATDFEREHLTRLNLPVVTQDAMMVDPAGAAATALAALPDGPLAVHVDVDVLDFTDAPLAENTSGRNIGPSLDQLHEALRVLVTDPRWRALSIGEVNPTRCAGDPTALTRLIDVLADVLPAAGTTVRA